MFQIHPSDLLRRRKRCSRLVERVLRLEQRTVLSCNVCGSSENIILATRDRYGFPVRTGMCRRCGLIYVLDRFTPEGYEEFYTTGSYRALITQFKGRRQTITRIRAAQVNYTASLVAALRGYVPRENGSRLLDIGGSTGLVAQGVAQEFGYSATVLDPAPDEIEASRALGVEAVVGTIESWETPDRFDLILLCRTIEHLFDLRAALAKIRDLLCSNGLLYCDIADFVEICRREGPPEAVTKVDHCYWLCQETGPALFNSLGFEVVSVHLTLPPDQVGFLLRKRESVSDVKLVASNWIEQQTRRFREIASDWERYGRRPLDFMDWMRKKAYRLKKRFHG